MALRIEAEIGIGLALEVELELVVTRYDLHFTRRSVQVPALITVSESAIAAARLVVKLE